MNRLYCMILTGLLFLLAPISAIADVNQWSGSGPFATGLGNRVITALAISSDGKTVYSGTGSGTVFSYAVTPPTVTTNAASGIGAIGATLNATVNANNADSSVTFEYGSTTAYGTSVAASPPTATGLSDTTESAAVAGLAPGDTYHYRVAAVSSSGTSYGGDQSFTMQKLNQSITFDLLTDKTYGDAPFTVSATSSSGLAVSFSTTSPGCTVSGTTVTINNAGDCAIDADQAGNTTYNPATRVTQTFTVNMADQSIGAISFIPASLSGGGTTTVGATATSGLAVTFSSTTPSICTVSGTTVSGITTGACTVAADQPGDTNYNPASRVMGSIDITNYLVTGSAVGQGAISCTSPVNHGASSACTITPDPGYRLTALTANTTDILGNVILDHVTIGNVTQAITVTATFSAANYGSRAVTSGNSDTGVYATEYSADGTQHLVYERGGSLYYRTSSGVSGNWGDEETVAIGHDPSIGIRQDGTPVVAFISGGEIQTTSRSASWSAPAGTGVAGANTVELAVDGNDHLHLAYTVIGSDGYDDILYSNNTGGSFGSATTICDGSYASGVWTFCRTPLIQSDTGGNYHIVYSKQEINASLGAHDPQYMVYTTNSGGGVTVSSHDLNSGAAVGTPQLLARGAFGHDTVNGYTLTYGNDMESSGIWLATNLQSGTWTESAAAVAGTLPAQGNDDTALTRHMAYITPDGRLGHVSLSGGIYSALTELAASGEKPYVNPVKRSVLYRAAYANGVEQLYQVGIGAFALLIPADGNLGNVVVGNTTEKSFTLVNNGSSPLTVSDIETVYPGYTFEIGTDNCTGHTLSAGETCAFTVKNSYQTYAAGVVTDTLIITSDDPVRGSITLPLSMNVVEPYYPLQINMVGSGTVTATASGQSDFTCTGGVCSRNYDTNTVVTLTAATPTGYTFTGFTFTGDGNSCCRDASCSVTITGNTSVTATFTRNSYVITTLPAINGSISCPSPVLYGASDTCTVTPNTGYRIEGVGGSCGGTLAGTTYTTLPVTASCTVEAVFAQATQRNVSVTLTGTGAGSVYSSPTGISCSLGICSALFDDATAATLTAAPDANSTFGGWSGACTNGSGPCELTLTSDKSVTAGFTAAPRAKVGETGYAKLVDAYTATTNGSVIKARSITFMESLILNMNRTFTLEGGFNAPYDCNTCSDNTVIRGTLTVEKGSVILENLTIR
jgi:hypothetical protein